VGEEGVFCPLAVLGAGEVDGAGLACVGDAAVAQPLGPFGSGSSGVRDSRRGVGLTAGFRVGFGVAGGFGGRARGMGGAGDAGAACWLAVHDWWAISMVVIRCCSWVQMPLRTLDTAKAPSPGRSWTGPAAARGVGDSDALGDAPGEHQLAIGLAQFGVPVGVFTGPLDAVEDDAEQSGIGLGEALADLGHRLFESTHSA